jgi:FMN phosphatase YigB (HAD superfamily)
MEALVSELAGEYELVLLSDHAAEWVEYVRAVHPFLKLFDIQVFSFETGQLKREVSTFGALLDTIGRSPEACLFVDDNPLNVQVADEAGIVSIRFVDARQLADALRAQDVLIRT